MQNGHVDVLVTEIAKLKVALLSVPADKQAIFDSLPDIICKLTDDGIIEEVGPSIESILGWAPEELTGRTILTIVPSERRDFVRKQLIRIRHGFVVYRSRREYLSKNGQPVCIEWSVARIKGGGILCFGRDVTQEAPYLSRVDYRNLTTSIDIAGARREASSGLVTGPTVRPGHESFAQLDELCSRLFDRWCERRNVVALAYLMHAWPIVTDEPLPTTRLIETLRDLKAFNRVALADGDEPLIDRVLAIAMTQ
jgi:PAS domain S-box-containing protein